ncbi:DoxX family protein [Sphingomonas sp. C3-2]|uniref:DoxX family protein n=1 Tax=Sphingomonas sp. C3-2 TaxID=3062169 RepID=UPI00294AC75E|nr:DoxX family protein [Sphingomonas sp. C3-2]WOK36662.1 DoxX family protein [Sphingomonas sp. C3-2]
MTTFNGLIVLLARVLLSAIFIWSGWGKVADIGGTAAYIASSGLPTILAWPSAFFELIVGLFVLIGFQTKWAALALAFFSFVTAFLFHTGFADPMQQINFFKNLAMTGGFLMLYAYPHNHYSIEAVWTEED